MSLENYGNYQLLKRLATGGMAQIYLARRKGPEASDELVVVKRILPHLGENKEFVQMFLDEAKIAARLAHPNIVSVHDLGAQDDSFFIAMEYIHGEDVRRLIKRTHLQGMELPVPLACRIIIDSCAGLDYAHKKTDPSGKPLNIVHRDVSPQNILVSFRGEVKVVDFGIAKAADQATVTRSGVLKGKYSYMSPEQASGKRVDRRSDVFALGVVLYELLTAVRLFKRASDMQTLTAVAECNVTPPSQVNPRVPAELDPIVMKALAKDPDARYAEAGELQAALEQWLRVSHTSATPDELAVFIRKVYADRLANEARSGSIVVEEEPPTTGARTAVGGNRRSANNLPSVSPSASGASAAASKEATRADRGTPAPEPEEAVELTDPTAQQRPMRNNRPSEARREPEPERIRTDKRGTAAHSSPHSGPRPTVDLRRPEINEMPTQAVVDELPTQAVDELSLAMSMTGTTQAPRRDRARRRMTAIVAASLSAVAMALALGFFLKPSPPPPPATVRIETVPPGARVTFDGKLLPGDTPMTLPSRPMGTYPLMISRDGYQELRATVTIPSTGTVAVEPLKLTAITPPPDVKPPEPVQPRPPPVPAVAAVKLTLETEPAQATIFVDGKERGPAPQVLEAKAEQELEVKASAPQYKELLKKVKVGAGPAQLERLVLEPLPKPPPTPTVKQPRVPDPPKPPPESPKGMVRFAVTPWAEVTCGGRSLGATPFAAVSLPVGIYQCKFYNPDLGRTLTQRVEVKPTGMNTVVVKF